MTLDRDIIIEATPATESNGAVGWQTFYINGSRDSYVISWTTIDNWLAIYRNSDCTGLIG